MKFLLRWRVRRDFSFSKVSISAASLWRREQVSKLIVIRARSVLAQISGFSTAISSIWVGSVLESPIYYCAGLLLCRTLVPAVFGLIEGIWYATMPDAVFQERLMTATTSQRYVDHHALSEAGH